MKTLYEKAFNEDFDIDKVREMYNEQQRNLLHNKDIK
jgi:3-methyladenine DNA glycosylase Tag